MNESLSTAWDKAAEKLGEYPFTEECVRYAAGIRPMLGMRADAHILEIGCGSGRLLRALYALGYRRLVGVEISPERLRKVRSDGPAAALICSATIPFGPASFDAAVSTGVIEHVAEPRRWLADIARVVRVGGIVSLTSDTYMWRWLQRLGLYHSDQPLDRAIWPRTLLRWAEEAGLTPLAYGGFVNTPRQRWFLPKALLKLSGPTRLMLQWIGRSSRGLPVPADESAAVIEAIRSFGGFSRRGVLACVWSYESFYWFRRA